MIEMSSRRRVIAGSLLAFAVFGTRGAMTQPASLAVMQDELIGLLRSDVRFGQLLLEMDLVCSFAAVVESRRKKEPGPPGGRQAFFAVRVMLIQNRQAVLKALEDKTGVEEIMRAMTVINPVLPRLVTLLTEGGLSKEIAEQLQIAFRQFNQLITVSTKSTDPWWCKCYGLSVLC